MNDVIGDLDKTLGEEAPKRRIDKSKIFLVAVGAAIGLLIGGLFFSGGGITGAAVFTESQIEDKDNAIKDLKTMMKKIREEFKETMTAQSKVIESLRQENTTLKQQGAGAVTAMSMTNTMLKKGVDHGDISDSMKSGLQSLGHFSRSNGSGTGDVLALDDKSGASKSKKKQESAVTFDENLGESSDEDSTAEEETPKKTLD